MARPCSIPHRGEVALLSVTHPILGTDLEVGAHTIRIGPEQYLGLVDDLCNIAFLSPRLATRIHSLALDLGVPEVAQYVNWLREADRRGAERISDPEVRRRRLESGAGSEESSTEKGNDYAGDTAF